MRALPVVLAAAAVAAALWLAFAVPSAAAAQVAAEETAQADAEAGAAQAETAQAEDAGDGTAVKADAEVGLFERLLGGERIVRQREYARPEQPTVYLSFDDGPSDWTPVVLDILAAEGVRATFFVLGEQAEKRGELVRRIAEEGHAVGNHTYNHNYEELYSGFETFWEQIRRTEEIIEPLVGYKPSAVRAPGGTYGHFDPFYFYYLDRAGYQVYDWNIDSGDSRGRGVAAQTIVENVKNSVLRHEAHVLLHDSAGHGETAAALPEIIRYFKELGYEFGAYGDDVQPVMFTAAPPRHSRSYELESFARMLAAADEADGIARGSGTEADAAAEPGSGQADDTAVAPLAAPPDADGRGLPQVVVRAGHRSFALALDAGDYADDQGVAVVPLRAFAEGIGASVSWNAEERFAVVRYGPMELAFHPAYGKITVGLGGVETETTYLADIRSHGGSLYVPLAAIASLLDYGVSTVATDNGSREVRLSGLYTAMWATAAREAAPLRRGVAQYAAVYDLLLVRINDNLLLQVA